MVVKPNAKKVRRIGEGVVAGFAGSAADGMSLLERLEMKLEEHPGKREDWEEGGGGVSNQAREHPGKGGSRSEGIGAGQRLDHCTSHHL